MFAGAADCCALLPNVEGGVSLLGSGARGVCITNTPVKKAPSDQAFQTAQRQTICRIGWGHMNVGQVFLQLSVSMAPSGPHPTNVQ